jgi:hypothetical protein
MVIHDWMMTGTPYNFGKLQILKKWTNDFSVFIRARSAAPRLWLLDSDFAAGSWHDFFLVIFHIHVAGRKILSLGIIWDNQ